MIIKQLSSQIIRKTGLSICFLFLFLRSWADAPLSVRFLTNNDGLSNSSVNCILQDSSNLLWFGTWDGLNLYNGSGFRTFKPDPVNPSSISNNIIRNIIQGNSGTLWIETDNGINRYQPATKSFDHFLGSNASIFKEHSYLISKNSKNLLFAAVYESGIYYFDQAKDSFALLDTKNINAVRKLFFDKKDNLWIVTATNELYKIAISYPANSTPSITSLKKANVEKDIESVFYNGITNRIWLQTKSKVIVLIDPDNENVKESGIQIKESLTSALFLPEQTWLGTTSSLYEVNPSTGKAETRLNNISVLSILKDTQGIIWVGTDAQGILMLTQPKEKFQLFSSNNIPTLGTAPVRAFFEDTNQSLWVGTKGNGLYLINEKNDGKAESVRFTTGNGLLSNSVYALSGQTNKELWIGTEGNGLNYYDFNLKKLFVLRSDSTINLTSIYSIYRQNDSVLWIGTSGYGLYCLQIDRSNHPYRIKKQRQFVYQNHEKNSLTNNVVYSIIPDGQEHLWIGTRGGGLNRLNIRTEAITNYRYDPNNNQSIGNDDVLCLYKDNNGILWVGTSNGLNKLETFTDGVASFRRYSEKDGLPNNTIHGILADVEGNLWLSSNKGLSKLNSEKNKIISYYQSDGLQNNEFSDGAFYASPQSSALYFGGINGYNKFDPLKISKSSYMPPLLLDAFFINNDEVNLTDYMVGKDGERQLEMSSRHKFFSFKFIPLDYLDAQKCELSYQLENYNKDWINLGTSGTIVFSNLPAGNYVLHVRSSNADKEWNEQIFTLPIKILPPWWLSWYAYLAYAVLAMALIYLSYRISRNRIEMRHRLELTTLENQQTEEIHQAKLRFFTNIAHEFCNSLTLIYGPSEQLLRLTENDTTTRKYLNIIKSNAERMQGLIQQLMEFRKAETGYLETEIESVDIPELIKYTTDHFIEMAEQKKIIFNMEVDREVGHWPTDRSCFEKILFNLLSNAFKYTPEQGEVSLRISMSDKNLSMIVSNTGPGIREDDQKQIFNRFTILDRLETQILKGSETRTGIGLALCKSLVDLLQGSIAVSSEPNKSTSFEVVLIPLKLTEKKERKENKPNTPALPNYPTKEIQVRPATNVSDTTPISSKSKPCILVIEDDAEIRMLLTDILQPQYEIIPASGGQEAFNLLQNINPDLILCDIIMPGMNGVEVVRQLKKQEVTAHIPVIFLSSEGSIESQIEGLQVGADAYLTKPFHTRHLEVAIEQLLSRQQNMRQYFESPISSIENMEGKLVHKEEKEFILKLTRVVGENIDNEKLSLDTLSNEMGVSKIQLYRKLKEIKGETPTEFIRKIRLKQAEKLLKTTSKTVQEIMYSCGFNNKAYFYREFAKLYNQTPKEYRNTSK